MPQTQHFYFLYLVQYNAVKLWTNRIHSLKYLRSMTLRLCRYRDVKTRVCGKSDSIIQRHRGTFLVRSIHEYVYIYTLLVCLFAVSNKRQNAQVNRSGQSFVWDLAWPQGRLNDAQTEECKKTHMQKLLIFVKF